MRAIFFARAFFVHVDFVFYVSLQQTSQTRERLSWNENDDLIDVSSVLFTYWNLKFENLQRD